MKRGLEQKLARKLLPLQQRGPTYGRFFRNNVRLYTFQLVVFAAVLGALAWFDQPAGFLLVLGIVIGALLRDAGWVRSIRRTWPFTVAVTDWEKVRRIADGESLV